MPALLAGAKMTIELAVISVAIGFVIGSLVGIARVSQNRALRVIAGIYVDFIRGTPLLVQLFLVYFGLPTLIGRPVPPFIAAISAMGINSGAYVAEIVRAGIQSIDRGQTEAARSLGLTSSQTMQYIIFPQAFRRIIPPLGNEFIAMLKDSSLVSVIALEDLLRKGQVVITRTFRPFEVYTVVALIYLVMTFVISKLVSWSERKLKAVGQID
ncbi:MAG TPA: amino acid ABC transporter permease [Bacillota bacterium]|jgi:polar amino acid transport system permease protein|nr:amino acid ABC transporter permease [Bacillota bacterium]HOK70554.1 amino acid ABC transporter permease [Bacillota bacterium]HOL51014.1 amino acid ABC transporter permease [Bacillota bacterium]HOO29930.1 amino acid ABC transporter permease [Bacillota bacterium]HPQ01798.1 amino acid ABC transporter permease [Bacillota bacterium]